MWNTLTQPSILLWLGEQQLLKHGRLHVDHTHIEAWQVTWQVAWQVAWQATCGTHSPSHQFCERHPSAAMHDDRKEDHPRDYLRIQQLKTLKLVQVAVCV